MVPESEEELGRILDKADVYSRKWRFKFSEKNSKVMVIAGRQEKGNVKMVVGQQGKERD